MKSKLNSALALAERGFKVFLLPPGQKAPPVKDWQRKATSDLETVKKLWAGRFQLHNIGVSTADLVVFDADGPEGKQSLALFVKQMGLTAATYAVRTKKGMHMYYQAPPQRIKNVSAVWERSYPGLHIRTTGGYVVGAGSEVEGHVYRQIVSHRPALLTAKAIELLPKYSDISLKYSDISLTVPLCPHTPTDLLASNPDAYAVLPDVIPVGERNNYMFGYVCSLIAKNLTPKQVVKKAEAAFCRCEQPARDVLPWSTVESMIIRAEAQYRQPQAPTASPEHAADILTDWLNRYVLVEKGSLVVDLQAHPTEALIKLEEWKTAHSNKRTKKHPLTTIWLRHPDRKSVTDTIYLPQRTHTTFVEQNGHTYYNVYAPANLAPVSLPTVDDVAVFTSHVEFLFNEHAITFLTWLAFSVQMPQVRIPWAPLLVTTSQGMGKAWLYLVIRRLLGAANCYAITPDDLTDSRIGFNEWLRGTLLCIDELEGGERFARRLKPLITEENLIINEKYGRKAQRQVFCNVLAFSNHLDAIQLDASDRRWWVVANFNKPRPPEYYTVLYDWLRTDTGPAALLRYLLNFDTSKFNYASAPPPTQAKQNMILESMSEVEATITIAVEEGQGVLAADITSAALTTMWLRETLSVGSGQNVDPRYVGRVLSKLSPAPLPQSKYRIPAQNSDGYVQQRLILLRNPEQWRDAPAEAVVKHYVGAYERFI